jgi:hypothetical protein
MRLRSRLILRVPIGMPVLAAMLFVPAGTWRHELAEQWKGERRTTGSSRTRPKCVQISDELFA